MKGDRYRNAADYKDSGLKQGIIGTRNGNYNAYGKLLTCMKRGMAEKSKQ